ncbi:MAG: hypothetical protein V1860_02255 [bacterium]
MKEGNFRERSIAEASLEERIPLMRDPYGNMMELRQGENQDERIGEYNLLGDHGEVIGRVEQKYLCSGGERVGLGIMRNLKILESRRFNTEGNVTREYKHEYAEPEEGNGAEGDYAHTITRNDATGDRFIETSKNKIQGGKYYPTGESFERNGILMTSKEFGWDDQGNVTSIKHSENDSEGNFLLNKQLLVERKGHSAKVRECLLDNTGNIAEDNTYPNYSYGAIENEIWGRISNRIETAK